MKKILVSSALALALSAFCLLSSGSAKAQEFFTNAYARPVEMVDGINVGARFQSGPRVARRPYWPRWIVTREPHGSAARSDR